MVGYCPKPAFLRPVGLTINNSVGDIPVPKSYVLSFKQDKDLTDMYVGYADGTFLDGGDWVPPADYNPTKRVWYQQAVAKNAVIFTDPYVDADYKKMGGFRRHAGEETGWLTARRYRR